MKTKELFNYDKFKNIKYINYDEKLEQPFYTIYMLIKKNDIINFPSIISVLNQTYKNFEFIILAEEENYTKILNGLKTLNINDKRLKIINQCSNNAIRELKKSQGEYFVQIDGESCLERTLLEITLYNIKFANKKESIIYSNIIDLTEKKNYNEIVISKPKRKVTVFLNVLIFPKKFLEEILNNNLNDQNITHINYYGVYAKTCKKENIKLLGGLENYPHSCLYNYNSEPNNIMVTMDKNNTDKAILCCMPWGKIGGADLFNLNVMKYLKEKGYSIYIITTEICNYEAREKFEEVADGYYDLTTFLKRENWADFIKNIIINKNIKLLFQMNSLYVYHLIPWLKFQFPKLPIIEYLHAEDFAWRNGGYPKDSTAVANFIDKTFTCNNHLKEVMYSKMHRINDNNVETLYIGVDTNKFNPEKVTIVDKETQEFCNGKKVILFPSRFSYEKRPLFLLKLMKEIKKERNDIVCLMVGDGDAKKSMQDYIFANNLKNLVKLIPMQQDIKQYYKMASVVVICSLSEGITLTTYESLSMNVPVVSADVGGQSEIVNGDTGVIIPTFQNITKDLYNFNYSKEELEQYKKAIYKIIEKKYPKNFLHNYVVNNCSNENMLITIQNNIEQLIKNKSLFNKNSLTNENFAIRYLILYNEVSKLYFNNSFEFDELKLYLKNKMWQKWWWRSFVKIAKKTHADKIIKKIYFKGR